MKDLHKTLYGEEAGTKLNLLKQGLLDIEKKHISYFKSRNSKIDYDEHDRLHNYYGMINNSSNIIFVIHPESDIDETIKKECYELFIDVFK
ncbi:MULTISPECIES: hypothetical protein [Mesonia]|uniref:Uncharacterized protein n=1 Tax=Mesonia oceanica TaxID=2687242 RepID=A0AC61Y7S3_9FLAO|nr:MULTISPECIES: hypothetical protein [Mesonia]MAN27048.1 hypothetical protein [Mesonia sp.]MAQ41442.1 hypothetical protein [Mesonia sp.]VVV00453.1 hypothetical protein FVB9532_01724 [Mesonia oceanica]|tara:strand:+ start:1072 stop:1344 length:273 start_codon:yes stop_codon:yes gene_type:complete